jgi:hypothetical protein
VTDGDEPPDGADWRYVRHLERRIVELEKWRATVEAASAWRHWALPFALSGIALATTIINVLHR